MCSVRVNHALDEQREREGETGADLLYASTSKIDGTRASGAETVSKCISSLLRSAHGRHPIASASTRFEEFVPQG
jgi:hypothetical protein